MGRTGTPTATAQVVGAVLSLQLGAALSVQLLDDVGAFGTLALRLLVAAVALALAGRAWRLLGRVRRDPGARRAVGLLGLAMVALSSTFYLALERLPLGVTVTLELLGPLLLTVLRGRRRRDLVCAALALLGVALLTGVTGGLDAPLDPLGVVLALAAGGFWALYILASQRAGSVSADGAALGVATALAAVLALPAGLVTAGTGLLEPRVLALGVVVGLLSSAVPYALELRALRHLPAATFGVLMSLEPAAAALAGWSLARPAAAPGAGRGSGRRGAGECGGVRPGTSGGEPDGRQRRSTPCAGIVTRSTVRPGRESTVISPECRSTTIRREMSSPRPVPRPTSLVVKNGSNACWATSADMPAPESSTSTTTPPWPSGRVRTRSVPVPPMASTALSTRFVQTWLSSPGTASTTGASGA